MVQLSIILKGMIALSVARFPVGTRGQDLDVLARINLWKAGLDYAHGTGHGVGAYLAVHEGPQNISKRGAQELIPGMIVSNEPGYYREGQFGIRIENLLAVMPATEISGGDILVDMLTDEERNWLNNYHASVYDHNVSHLDDTDRKWLEEATKPL